MDYGKKVYQMNNGKSTSNGRSIQENCAYLKATGEEIRSLYQKYMSVRGKDACAEQRWLREIGLRHGRRAAWMAAPGDDCDWWCVWCERVSVQPKPLDSTPRCRYSDCDPRARFNELRTKLFGPPEVGQSFSYYDGRNWFVIRRDLHPEYPEKAEPGQRYPVPEIKPSLRIGRDRPG